MTDLERFFRHLVATLSSAEPARLAGSLTLDDIQHAILPYRTHRRVLALESSEDYEALLMRLCAGEEGLARTEPADVQFLFQRELDGPNPDLGLLREHGGALVTLSPSAVRRVLTAVPDSSYAPPGGAPVEETPAGRFAHTARPVDPGLEAERAPELELPQPLPPHLGEALPLDAVRQAPEFSPAPPGGAPPMCLYCGGTLPVGRQVNFCPHCGESQTTIRCPECQSEVELGWRHCITCGAAMEQR
ncbi:MAG TPA: zinc ribbon domain-containing protein [Gemmatimonadales bacterium]|nr:zinc ribbon domain-containing protein [Gemmatimonadales bacterium]